MVKRKRKRNKLKSIYFFFGFGIFLILLLILIVLISFGAFENSREIQKFSLEDRCTIVIGNLIHQIRDTGECHLKCVNECEIRKLDFDHIEFVAQNLSCNDCYCYCN